MITFLKAKRWQNYNCYEAIPMLTWKYESVYKVLYFKETLPCQFQELLFGISLALDCLIFNLLSLAVAGLQKEIRLNLVIPTVLFSKI